LEPLKGSSRKGVGRRLVGINARSLAAADKRCGKIDIIILENILSETSAANDNNMMVIELKLKSVQFNRTARLPDVAVIVSLW